MRKFLLPLVILSLFACNCEQKTRQEADTFLKEYNDKFQQLYFASSEAEWKSNTEIIDGDTTNEYNNKRANEAMAAYVGSKEVIEKVKQLLGKRDMLTPLQVRQLNRILYMAADGPMTVEDLVKKRIEAQVRQTKTLFGFKFVIGTDTVTPNQIDNILKKETDLKKRLDAWNSSKEVGKALKPGLVNLRELRNKTVQALGYPDFFSYQVSDYGMSREEMMKLCEGMIKDVWPLYRELHTWTRYELAKRYKTEVPEYLPAHWLPNRWGQDWSALVEVPGFDIDAVIREKGTDWVVRQAEKFYMSLGFDSLPATFWEKSSLYPAEPGAKVMKNTHASAWHMNRDHDVRCLMGVEANGDWYETTHHEYGHIYYFLTYSTPEVPLVLREGANRAYHEAFGSMMGLAAMQKPFLENLGLVKPETPIDTVKNLLKEALNYIIVIPWGAGTMTGFEHDLYAANLPENEFNRRWWELAKKYQGIVPPAERGEEFCDAATKTHINDDPAQYYDYSISFVQLFQMHDFIAKKILHQDPRFTNYFGNKEIGKFLLDMMKPGATRDWRELYKEKVGADLSAAPMLDYFAPLMEWLRKENAGRKYTLPENL